MTAENRILALDWARQDVVPQGTALPPERASDVIRTCPGVLPVAGEAAPARMLFTIAIEGDPEMPLTVDSANAVAILSFDRRPRRCGRAPGRRARHRHLRQHRRPDRGSSGRGCRRERRREHPVPADRGRRGHRHAVRGRDRREREPAARPGRGHPDPGSRAGRGDGQPGRARRPRCSPSPATDAQPQLPMLSPPYT